MLDEKEVARWIARLETEESSWTNYERLATLYTIRNNQSESEVKPAAESAIQAPAVASYSGRYGDSDFLQAVSKCDPVRAWEVIDELMSTLEVVNPKAYRSVMRKLFD